MLYNNLAVSTTNRCNAKCDFCGVSACSSNTEEKCLSIEFLEKICKEASEIEMIKNIVFTGGEAFLCFDKINTIIPLLKKAKKNVGIVSNGFVFGNIVSSKKMIYEMSKNGLSFLHISTDQYHLKYVDLNAIKNAILLCKEFGVELTLKIGIQYMDKTYNRIIEELGESIFNASIQIYPIIPIGRAASLLKEEKFFTKSISNLNLFCKHSTTMFIDEKGDIYPCCFFVRPKNMVLGNIKTTSIREAFLKARRNRFYKEIYFQGFDKLVDNFVCNGIISEEDEYVDVCHLCNEIFGNNKYQTALKKYCNDREI